MCQFAQHAEGFLLHFNAGQQALGRLHSGQLRHQRLQLVHLLLGSGHICLKGGVFEALINRVQIPEFIHNGQYSFFNFLLLYTKFIYPSTEERGKISEAIFFDILGRFLSKS